MQFSKLAGFIYRRYPTNRFVANHTKIDIVLGPNHIHLQTRREAQTISSGLVKVTHNYPFAFTSRVLVHLYWNGLQ